VKPTLVIFSQGNEKAGDVALHEVREFPVLAPQQARDN